MVVFGVPESVLESVEEKFLCVGSVGGFKFHALLTGVGVPPDEPDIEFSEAISECAVTENDRDIIFVESLCECVVDIDRLSQILAAYIETGNIVSIVKSVDWEGLDKCVDHFDECPAENWFSTRSTFFGF